MAVVTRQVDCILQRRRQQGIPSQSDCSPSVGSCIVANSPLQVVSSVVGLDSMVACEGGRLGALLWVLTTMVARVGDWGLKLVK